MRSYELTFIVSPEVEEEALEGTMDQVKQFVVAGGGQVTNVDIWGRRRLAYPIRKHLEGYYAVMQTQIPREALPELERNLKLSEDVIRYLLVRLEA
jgi:small subunit ribosomal protein S6